MFKNITYLALPQDWTPDQVTIEAALDAARFIECTPTQEKSIGWVEPRGEANGPLIENINGQYILKLAIETRTVPGAAITRKAEEMAAKIEEGAGNKPGKKQMKEIKEEAKATLLAALPPAFSKKSAALVWINPKDRLLVIEASTQTRADEIITCLVKTIEGFGVTPIETQQTATAAMSQWLDTQEPPFGFTTDRECVLKACDESKARVRFDNHSLDTDEVKEHIAQGKLPLQLALTYDSRASFMLTDKGAIKKIKFLDVVFDGKSSGKDDAFDADTLIATSELSKMIPAVIEALGGRFNPQIQ